MKYVKFKTIKLNKIIAKNLNLSEEYTFDSVIDAERETGVNRNNIKRSCNFKNKNRKGSSGINKHLWIFDYGDEYEKKVPYPDVESAKEDEKFYKIATDKKEYTQYEIKKVKSNLKMLGIEVVRIDNKILAKCMCCNENLENLKTYESLIKTCLCKDCLSLIKSYSFNYSDNKGKKLLDVRPEIFSQNGGNWIYDEKLNDDRKLDIFD